MALDWIKMRTDIYRDPKVIIIADMLMQDGSDLCNSVSRVTSCDMCVTCNVTRHAVVGALVSVWGVLRHQGSRVGENLLVTHATFSVIDNIAELPGLGKAMAAVGWIESTPKGIVFPGFFSENNTDPNEIKKARAAERQRKCREKKHGKKTCDNERDASRDNRVTCHAHVTHREEKRREEKSIKEPPIPPEGGAADADGESLEISKSALAFVRDSWNASGAITNRKLTQKLIRSCRARLRDPWWSEHWLAALEKIPRCPFLLGENDTGWKADLEWFLRPDSVQRIIEGKYDAPPPTRNGVNAHGVVQKSSYTPAPAMTDEEAGVPY